MFKLDDDLDGLRINTTAMQAWLGPLYWKLLARDHQRLGTVATRTGENIFIAIKIQIRRTITFHRHDYNGILNILQY